MTFLSLMRVELGRLFREKRNWVLFALAVAGPAVGIFVYRPIASMAESAYVTSLNGTYLGNPALAGALIGALAFGLLTALELDRGQRFRTDVLMDAITSPVLFNLVRTIVMFIAIAAVQLAVLIVWYPYTSAQIGSVFRFELYVSAYLIIMFPAMIIAVTFTASAYQISHRLDITLVLFAVFLLLSFSVWQENWLLRWVNPSIGYLSDDFGYTRLLRSIAWNRLFWFLLMGAIWSMSYLCIRRYGLGLMRSAIKSSRKGVLTLSVLLLAACGCFVYTAQPFVDHSKLEIGNALYMNLEYSDAVTYSSTHVDARPDLMTGRHFGTATYQLHNSSGQPQVISFRINPGYSVSGVAANDIPVTYRDLNDDDQNGKTIEIDLPADQAIELVIEYGGFPQEWNILSLVQGDLEVSDDYIYLANEDFAPLPWNIMPGTDGPPPYTATLFLPEGMTPVLFGAGSTVKGETSKGGMTQWRLEDTGRSMILYAGDYVSRLIPAAGINVEFFYSKKHQRVMDECNVDDVIRKVFEYCTANYGPLKFYGDKTMRLIEIGSAGGGYAGRGASVMGEDSFNEQGLKDPSKGASGSEVLAHEIIHQWWGLGNMFEPIYDELWSSEGLTVYTTYRLMKELHGDAYAKEHYVEQWQKQVDGYYDNFYVRNPEYLEVLPETYRADITNSFASVRRYAEMPLKILKAEQLVGGEEKMDEILRGLFNREIDYSYPYLTYQDFLNACGLTEEDLNIA